jgi:hypothetical protein
MSNVNFLKNNRLQNGYVIVLVGAATAMPSTTPQIMGERPPEFPVTGLVGCALNRIIVVVGTFLCLRAPGPHYSVTSCQKSIDSG